MASWLPQFRNHNNNGSIFQYPYSFPNYPYVLKAIN